MEKGEVGDVYDLEEGQVYLRFDYSGDIRAVQRRVLYLLRRMPPP